MSVSTKHDPRDAKVVDQFLSAIYEMETFNHHAHGYAMEVLHHYFDYTDEENEVVSPFREEWFEEYILTEEFRQLEFLPRVTLRKYEKMHGVYWDARAEWFALMVCELNAQNMRESTRNFYANTLWNNTSWKDYARNAQRQHITHLQSEED